MKIGEKEREERKQRKNKKKKIDKWINGEGIKSKKEKD